MANKIKQIAIVAMMSFILMLSGCGKNLSPQDNISPKLDQKLDSIEGHQATLENNQNAIKLELGRLQNEMALNNSNNNQMQQGWVNIQSDGVLIGVFGLMTIGMILFYMSKAKKYKQISDILGQQVQVHNQPEIKERIMAAAWNTNVEKDIYKLVK